MNGHGFNPQPRLHRLTTKGFRDPREGCECFHVLRMHVHPLHPSPFVLIALSSLTASSAAMTPNCSPNNMPRRGNDARRERVRYIGLVRAWRNCEAPAGETSVISPRMLPRLATAACTIPSSRLVASVHRRVAGNHPRPDAASRSPCHALAVL